MSVSIYAGRYARTLFRLALENKELNRWQSDLHKVATLPRDQALFKLLENPQVSWDEKSRVLGERFGEIDPTIQKLISLLVTRGRLASLDEIADEYQRLVDNYRGIEGAEIAEVITAVPLDEAYQLRLGQRITDIIGKPVILKPRIDPGIIGGIIIRVGDKLIDGSVRNKLAELKKDLGRVAK